MKQSILLVFFFLTCMTSFAQSDESNMWFKQGIELYKQNKYQDAIGKFQRCQEIDDIEMDSLDIRKQYSKEWIAHCFYKLSDIEKAKSLGVQDYDIVPIDRTLTTQSDSIFALAHIIASNGNIMYAISKWKEGLLLEEQNLGNDNYAVANSHANLAPMYVSMNDFETAKEEIQQAKNIYIKKKLDCSYSFGTILLGEAYIEYYQGNIEEYMRLAEEALNLISKWENAESDILISVYHLLATGENQRSHSSKGENYVLSLQKELNRINEKDIPKYADQIHICCQGLIYHNHTEEAFTLLNNTLDYCQRHYMPNANNQFYITLLYSRANLNLVANRLDEAVADTKQIISICENTMFFDKNMLDEVYVTLASIYARRNEPILELEAAKEGYKRASQRADDRRMIMAKAKSFMAGAQFILEHRKEARLDIEESLRLYEQMGLAESGSYATELRLKAQIEQNSNPQQAIDDCEKSASLFLNQPVIQYEGVAYSKLLLYSIYIKQNLTDEAEIVFKEIEDIAQNSSIVSSEKDRILMALYQTKAGAEGLNNPELALKYYQEAGNISLKYEGMHTPAIDANIARCLARKGNVYEATTVIDSLIASLKTKENMDLQYADALNAASLVYGCKGDVLNMKRFQNEALELVKKLYGVESMSYANYLSTMSYQLLETGLATEAAPLCKEAEKKLMKFYHADDAEMFQLYENLLQIEYELGNLDNAIRYGEKARSITTKYDYLQLANCEILVKLSICYRDKCQFNEAINLLNEALAITEKYDRSISTTCASIYNQLSSTSQAMGNYSDAKIYSDIAYEITRSCVDPSNPQYTHVLYYKAQKEAGMGNFDNAIELITEAKDILENSLGEFNNITLNYKALKAQLQMYQGNTLEALIELEYLNNIYNIKNKNNFLPLMYMLSTAYRANGQYQDQIKLANRVLDIVDKKYGKGSIQAGNTYLDLATAYYNLGNIKKSAEYSVKTFDTYRKSIMDNFLFMSRKERADLWNSASNFFQVALPTTCAQIDNHDEFAEVTYNAALLSKGLLLQAETNISDMIYNSNNEELKEEYAHFLNIKQIYNNATSAYSSDAALEEKHAKQSNIDSLANEVVSIEHSLMKHINQDLGDYTSSLSTVWTDVRNALNTSDLAIEFLQAFYSPDSSKYYALVVTKDAKKPIYIDLFSGKELDNYKNFKTLSDNDLKKFAESLWNPILSKFPKAQNIYFSPCGELYNLPIESILCFDNSYNSATNYKLYRVSSTREISSAYSKWTNNTISLYGNIKYDATENELIENSKKYRTRSDFYTDLQEDEENGRGAIVLHPLPGTEVEINSIKSIIESTNKLTLSAAPYKGIEASEAAIKAMSGEGNRVLHIATHGFYIPESKISNSKYLKSVFSIENRDGIATYDTPEDAALLRSGLFMAGAKNKLNKQIKSVTDDGILNAREISMMNLKGLDLAVLSACETGIGDVSGEGVFGLQRGFKKAGTHSILMSLWKVDDDATAFLMKEFYNYWLSGNSKLESLDYAKDQVRKQPKWSSPRFWAAFVLLDGIN